MSELLEALNAPKAPVERKVTIDGKEQTVYFRRPSAGQRRELLEGTKIQTEMGKTGMIEVDLGKNEAYRQKLVLFTVCNADGEQLFKRLSDVEKLDDDRFKPLADKAEEVDQKHGDDPGKS